MMIERFVARAESVLTWAVVKIDRVPLNTTWSPRTVAPAEAVAMGAPLSAKGGAAAAINSAIRQERERMRRI